MNKYFINTPCGPIEGTDCRLPGVIAFKGIRFATAGRWEYPKQVTSWEGTYQAKEYGNCCYQPRSFYNEAEVPEKAFYYNEFRKGETYTYSEDCLFLNIWMPENNAEGRKLPVLFYIHGGGFTGGCGHEKHFDDPVWPTKDVIAVTCNYRLGPLGFFTLPELEEEAGRCGNYGLEDCLCALNWVHDNIEAFGGDPKSITIMGQSAGAMSVQQLCLSPKSADLIAGAVMSSGGGVMQMMSAPAPSAHYPFWHQVMELAGCKTLEELRELPADKLFAAWQEGKKANPRGGAMGTSPVLDGEFITHTGVDALKQGIQKNIPYMMGSTSEDMMPPIILKMAKDYCRAQYDQKKQPSYTWFFDRQLPGDDCGAWHSSDLWYWFGTLENGWRPWTKKDERISMEMVNALVNFCRCGNPNGIAGVDGYEKLPVEWLPIAKGQSKVLRWGEKPTHMGGVNMAKLAVTMATKPSVGE